MRPTWTIHTPSVSDYPELARIWEASVRATHHFLTDDYIVLLRDMVDRYYLDAVILICCRDNRQRITGFAGIAAGKLEMLFIDPAWRGQGVGTRLLDHAIEHFNVSRLDVNEQNDAALGFYQRQGFVVVGRSETDGLGRPYPLLHMSRLAAPVVRAS